MPTLAELIRESTDLDDREVEHLHRLVGSWQLLADLSFADLLLWCPLGRGAGFTCVAQMRPYTAQTLHPEDVLGKTIRPEELPVIDRAFLEGRSWRRDEPVLIDGVSVRMEAFPVPVGEHVVAVMSKEGAPLTHRRPGRLESNYLECGAALGRMVSEGTFPFAAETLNPELSPRVGDGMLRLDRTGTVMYASPNAISAFRRLGVVSNIEGEILNDVGLDAAPASLALSIGIPAEADVEVGGTVVLQRAIPFLEGSGRVVTGAVVLIRDVTELRYRERQLEHKEAVIREIHHRVKNNLQTIASLLRLQSRRLVSPEAKEQLQEAVRRIASIAVVHETLSRDSSGTVEFLDVAEQLVRLVKESLTDPEVEVSIDVIGDPGKLPAELATPLAVVLVELLQNAVEHGLRGKGGHVHVAMRRSDGRLNVVVADSGKGLPEGFTFDGSGLGLQIVKSLIESEIGGTISVGSGDSGSEGTRIEMDFPTRRRAGLRP
ncbi:MAG: sensor histidine kinase [Actinomycetota bacterium]